jgi:DNA polymerase V
MLMDLRDARARQPHLFTELDQPQSSPLDETLDAVNRRFGRATLRYAAVGYHHPWAMQRNHCSPRYTTAWPDLPAVKA